MIRELMATPVSARAYEHGEGPRYDAGRGEVLWVDIEAGRLLRARPRLGDTPAGLDEVTEVKVGRALGAVAPAATGGWVLAAGRGLARLGEDGVVVELAELEPADNRMNDAACDPQGRFWAGSMAYNQQSGAGSLYRLDPDGTVTTVLRGLTIANGLGWSPDGATFYHADSGVGTVTAYDFDAHTGAITRPRVLVRPERGVPDGLTVDDEGFLWVALWGGASVDRFDPAGEREATVPLPVSQPTSPCLVGSWLLITTASEGLTQPEAAAGRLFAVDVGVGGPPAAPFRG